MGIFSRLAQLIKSNINDLISRLLAEDVGGRVRLESANPDFDRYVTDLLLHKGSERSNLFRCGRGSSREF